MIGPISPWLLESPKASSVTPEEFGRKALGLLSLPVAWVPPFFLLPASLHERWESFGSADASVKLAPAEAAAISNKIDALSKLGARKLIVRSSTDTEDLLARGRFLSIASETSLSSVLESVSALYRHARAVSIERYRLGVVIQYLVQSASAIGHLSNERRLSPLPTYWLCEVEKSCLHSLGGLIPVEPTLGNTAYPSLDSPLVCVIEEELRAQWSALAAWCLSRGQRLHFEWLWDGNRLWLLQADKDNAVADPGPRVANACVVKDDSSEGVSTPRFIALVRAQELPPGLSAKADWLRVFERQGLPTGIIWGLHATAATARLLAQGRAPVALLQDLVNLVNRPTVIRTDLPAQDKQAQDHLFLPHSGVIRDLDSALLFLKDICRRVTEKGESDGVIFLMHHFVPSLASALCYANPNNENILVDSIWGLPDGLQHCPHDSFCVVARGSQILSRKIRFKSTILDQASDGSWSLRSLGEPWDWQPSLTDEEVKIIATATLAVAKSQNTPLQIMWFAGLQGPLYPPCLPWYVLPSDLASAGESPSLSLAHATRLRVESEEDIDRVSHQLAALEKLVTVIDLRPRSTLLRSKKFLADIAELATRFATPVLLYGSVLSHAYYVLRRSGVVVLSREDISDGVSL